MLFKADTMQTAPVAGLPLRIGRNAGWTSTGSFTGRLPRVRETDGSRIHQGPVAHRLQFEGALALLTRFRCSLGFRISISGFLFLSLLPYSAAATPPTFERDILPLFTKHCLACHGGLKQNGGLDMRTLPALLNGGDSGVAIKAGHPDAGELWKMIAADEMPKEGDKLSPGQKALVKEWIAAGLPTVTQLKLNTDPLLPAGAKHEAADVAAAIDRHLDRALDAVKLKPAPASEDAEFLRRVYLDLAGRVPTAAQATAFLDSTDAHKRAALVDALLAAPEFGGQFGRAWRDWIAPPELPSDPNSGRQPHEETRALGEWFAKRFNENAPWDAIVRDLVTAEGEIKAAPHIIFFGLAGDQGKTTPDGTARAVSSLFMGVQLQCAQCHDDPYRAWAQQEHWALAAFFDKTSGDFKKISESPAKANDAKAARIDIPKTAFRNAGTEVPAAFLGGPAFEPDQGGAMRDRFAGWLASKENPFFARAFANRVWFHLFARGLVNPVDDMRELNPPSHPGLLALLANEFSASNFDVKHVFRVICNSRAYQRTSRPPPGLDEPVLAALTDAFGRMPLRVMTADTLYDSLKLAYGDPKLDLRSVGAKDGNTSGESAAVGDPYLEFDRAFRTNEEDATDFTHGIPQMLAMLNHPRLTAGGKALEDFRKSDPAPEKTVEWLYLSTLSRRPTAGETADAVAYLAKADDPAAAYPGVLWSLVNRSEYLFVP